MNSWKFGTGHGMGNIFMNNVKNGANIPNGIRNWMILHIHGLIRVWMN